MMHSYVAGWHLFWLFISLAFIAAVVVVVVFVVKGNGSHHQAPHAPQPPQGPPQTPSGGPTNPADVLDHRLATGQIDVDTYRAARDALNERKAIGEQ